MYSWLHRQWLPPIFPRTNLSLLGTCMVEEFLYAYSKKIKAALNPLRDLVLSFTEKKGEKRKGVTAEKRPS